MPGASEVRMTDCSLLSGLARGTTGALENSVASASEMKVGEMASLYHSASRVERILLFFSACACSTTPPEKAGKVSGNLL